MKARFKKEKQNLIIFYFVYFESIHYQGHFDGIQRTYLPHIFYFFSGFVILAMVL